MPTRMVRDSVLDSDRYHAVDKTARLAYLEMLLCADDFALLPLSDTYLDRHCTAFLGLGKQARDTLLISLMDVDLVRLYDVAGARFAYIPRFGNAPRARKPKWPMPPETPAFEDFHVLRRDMNIPGQDPRQASKTTAFQPRQDPGQTKEPAKNNNLAENLYSDRSRMHTSVAETVFETVFETETDTANTSSPGTSPKPSGKPRAAGKTLAAAPASAPRPKETRPAKPVAEPTAGAKVFEAYREAYRRRYHTDPVRNQKVNSQCKQVAERLGAEAPDVAAFYLGHDNVLYVRAGHVTDLLLRDAEKLRTEWFTNTKIDAQPAASFRKADSDAKAARIFEMTGGAMGRPAGAIVKPLDYIDMETGNEPSRPRLDR